MILSWRTALMGNSGPFPPTGYVFLRGKNADTSHTILRAQTSAGAYINLSGRLV